MAIYNPPPTAVPTAHHTTHEQGGSDLIANAAWTNASNIFTNPEQRINGATYARLNIKDLSQPADQRQFDVLVQNQKLALRPTNDGDAATATGLVLDRSANVQVGGNLAIGGAALGTNNVARTDAANVFSGGTQTIQAAPLDVIDGSMPVDQRKIRIAPLGSGYLYLYACTDAGATGVYNLVLDRSGNAKVGADLYEKGRTTPLGHWINIPYNAANFTASTGIWTVEAGDYQIASYTLIGKTCVIQFTLNTTTVSASPVYLYWTLAFGLNLTIISAPFFYIDPAAAAWKVGNVNMGSSNVMSILKDPSGTPWTSSTNGTFLQGTVIAQIV